MEASVSGEQTGAARWLSVHDDLLRGLTHALSNRVGTLSAVAYMVEMQPATVGASVATLRAEAERLEAVLQLMRLLPRKADATAEPVIPTDTTTQAVALQSYHPNLGDVAVVVTLDGDLQPAYADPAVLVMAVTLILGAAQRAVRGAGRVDVTISSSTEVVRIRACGVGVDGTPGHADADSARDVDAVNWLLAPFDGSGAPDAAGAVVSIPTLQAARRARHG